MRVFSAAWPGADEASDGPGDGERLPTIVEDGITIDRVWTTHRQRHRIMSTYFRSLARYCARERSPDAVLLLNSWLLAPHVLRTVRRRGIPIIYVQTMMRDPSLSSFKNRIWAYPLQRFDRIVASTGVMRRALRDQGIRTPIDVVPNGVDLSRFTPCRSPAELRQLRQRLGIPPDDRVVTFVGGFLSPRKGLDLLVHAWSSIAKGHSRARLVLVGPHLNTMRPEGPQIAFLERLKRSLHESGAEDRVTFTGRVTDVEEYLRATDVFVFPSRLEGMPNVVPEAFACGVACVLTPFTGLPREFGEPGREYVLVQHDPDGIASAVSELLTKTSLRRAYGARARAWVRNELDVERSLDRYADLIAASVTDRGRRQA